MKEARPEGLAKVRRREWENPMARGKDHAAASGEDAGSGVTKGRATSVGHSAHSGQFLENQTSAFSKLPVVTSPPLATRSMT